MSRVTKIIGGKEFGSKTYLGFQEINPSFDFTKPYALFLVRDEDVIVSYGLDSDGERLQDSFDSFVDYLRDHHPWCKILGRPGESGLHWRGVKVRTKDLEFISKLEETRRWTTKNFDRVQQVADS